MDRGARACGFGGWVLAALAALGSDTPAYAARQFRYLYTIDECAYGPDKFGGGDGTPMACRDSERQRQPTDRRFAR